MTEAKVGVPTTRPRSSVWGRHWDSKFTAQVETQTSRTGDCSFKFPWRCQARGEVSQTSRDDESGGEKPGEDELREESKGPPSRRESSRVTVVGRRSECFVTAPRCVQDSPVGRQPGVIRTEYGYGRSASREEKGETPREGETCATDAGQRAGLRYKSGVTTAVGMVALK